MNWFRSNDFCQDRDKDSHPHLERIFIKSFLSFSFPERNSSPWSYTQEYTTFSALATPCPLCDLPWLKQ